ncbi:hypothetical protein LQR31_22125 [Chromobacterium vaccinii]|uniref:Uncharacterized protein n=4 Tax=Chromobacteriaceae TaxID=1499392 RepID=A0A1D9LLE2_9NEIS|nr:MULTISPECIES: hypothetical protein [Chromobacteriaceae]AOZ52128.1 hypothetical protein BKX93_20410 [Chromobacterium vaccinii]AVG16463.1 type III secretion protein [Chromobacterium vaccinii]ERE19480.1 hypothetical protein O166_20160 [Pseudogulbenkiania ferrooxidans EGD-HP2]MCD4487172.1 hypothetical protein [Chromobacterium vaccinii]MCD4500980.1 hypothetical protein [Chromobacterium vaccinii]
MLSQLLCIKRRRENSLRAALVRLADEELKLCARRDAIHERRHALYAEWRLQAARSGQFDQTELEKLRAALSRLEGEDQSLQRQLEELAAERLRLTQTRAEQETMLLRNLREQEKLSALLDDESDKDA